MSELKTLESYLTNVAYMTDTIICMGDFNINMLNQSDAGVRYILNIMSFFSLKQLIMSPTRITRDTASLLDLILVSSDRSGGEIRSYRYHKYQ